MKIKVLDYKEYSANTLQAFVDLELEDIGLTINGCSLHSKEGRTWVSMPQREYQTKEGDKKWANILWWAEKNKADEFREAALEAIKAFRSGDSDKPAEGEPAVEPQTDIPF